MIGQKTLYAQQDISHTDAEGNERVVKAGEQVRADDPLVTLHPFQFLPEPPTPTVWG